MLHASLPLLLIKSYNVKTSGHNTNRNALLEPIPTEIVETSAACELKNLDSCHEAYH